MSWAAGRDATQLEDEVYSLLGIFGVNMTMLYGKGDGAFVRLQREVMRATIDLSLLALESVSLKPQGHCIDRPRRLYGLRHLVDWNLRDVLHSALLLVVPT